MYHESRVPVPPVKPEVPQALPRCQHHAPCSTPLIQSTTLQAFGWVYTRYEMDYNTWEVMLLGRRFFMAVVAVFLFNTPYVQLSMGIIIVSLMTGAHFFARPFRSTALDLMDSLALLQVW